MRRPPRSTLFPTRRSSDLSRSLTAGIPVSLREADDNRPGTAIGMIIAELGTNAGDPRERLEVVKRSTSRRSEEHTSELQSRFDLVCRLLLEKKKTEKQHDS